MPTNKEPSAETDLSRILEGLLKANIKFILVGGLAAVIQGAPVTTMDVDIVHNQSSDNISKLLSFLKSISAVHRRPDNKILEAKKHDITGKGHALFTTKLGPLDVLAAIEGGKTYDDLIHQTVEIDFRGFTLHVLNLQTLVSLKQHTKDPVDKHRLRILEETLRQLDD